MRDIIERLFGPKRAGAFVMAITLLGLPGCAIAPKEHTQSKSPTSSPGLKTGSDYLSVCGRALDDDSTADARAARMNGLACSGYMWGVLSGFSATQTIYEGVLQQPKLLCLPTGVNVSELTRISLNFIAENPAALDRSLGELIMVSWIASFPCPEAP
jgi:hypothetical protein